MTTTLITGANRSLGLETARRLVEAGHTVLAGMRDTARGDDARAVGATPVQLDVDDQASVDRLFSSLDALDVLVNNAGILGGSRDIDDVTIEDLEAVLAVNVSGVLRVTRAALPLLRRSSSAVVVNVASGVGWPRYLQDPEHDEFPIRNLPYATSKAALIAMTVQMAKNLPGMRVNATDPGYTATDFNGHSGHQTVTEGTDATVRMALLGPDGPTGELHDRHGRIPF